MFFKILRNLIEGAMLFSLTACFLVNDEMAQPKSELPKMESLQPVRKSIFTISGQLLDWRAKPLAEAVLTFKTADNTIDVTTSDEGFFTTQIVQSENEPIEISLKSKYGDAQFLYKKFYTDGAVLSLDLMLGADNTLEIIEQ